MTGLPHDYCELKSKLTQVGTQNEINAEDVTSLAWYDINLATSISFGNFQQYRCFISESIINSSEKYR